MNNKGFIFIETIITVVILTTTLVLIYAAYSNVIITEQSRLYHDDVAYIYKTEHIRDMLAETVDLAKFTDAVNYKLDEANKNERMYMYVFNVESDIFLDNKPLIQMKDLYNIYRLVYIRKSDLKDLKQCIKTGIKSEPVTDDEHKCNNTLWFSESHGFRYLKDYLLTIDVDEDASSAKGILISLLYETKNGGSEQSGNGVVTVGKGKYSECLYEKVRKAKNISETDPNLTELMEQSMHEYIQNDNLRFNMGCENAYYLSWVYLW